MRRVLVGVLLWSACGTGAPGAETPQNRARAAAEAADPPVPAARPASCPALVAAPEPLPGVTPAHRTLAYWTARWAAEGDLDAPVMTARDIDNHNRALAAPVEDGHPLGQTDLLAPIDPAELSRSVDERLAYVRGRLNAGEYVGPVDSPVDVRLLEPPSALPALTPTVRVAAAPVPIRCTPLTQSLFTDRSDPRFDRNACSTARAGEPVQLLAPWGHGGWLARTPYALGWVAANAPLGEALGEPEAAAALTAATHPLTRRALLGRLLNSGSLAFRAAGSVGELLDAALICVPTPLAADGQPDLGAVRAAARALAPELAETALVVLESTTWPGTTREELGAELRAAGRDPLDRTLLAFSPERVDPGRLEPPLRAVPKLVGGTSEAAGALAAILYRRAFDDVRLVSSAEVAEAAKLTENVYRAVNIALANELSDVHRALGLDPHEVVEAAASKPFGFQRFDSGPGVGGHCIPIDPAYLTWAARREGLAAPLVELALEINNARPRQLAAALEVELERTGKSLAGARVLLLGLAYKPGSESTASSPGLELAHELHRRGAHVDYADPHVPCPPAQVVHILGNEAVKFDRDCLAQRDAAILLTPHPEFDLALLRSTNTLVLDPRGALRGSR